MKAKKSILAILLTAILLVGFLPAQKLEAAWGPTPKPPVEDTEPKPEPEPEPKPEPEPEPIVEPPKYEEPDSSRDTDIGDNETRPTKPVVKPIVKEPEKVKMIKIHFTVGKSIYIKDYEEIEMDGKPFIKNDRIMIPLRYAAESLGMKVEYDESIKTATFTNEKFIIKINISTGLMTINGEVFQGEAPPELVEDRIYVSLGVLAESMGMTRENPDSGNDLSWNQEEKTATLTQKVK